MYFAVATQLPIITNDNLEEWNFAQTSIITDKNGEVLYRFYEENRKFVDFEDIAPQTINAFIAIEDQSFWKNGGVDYKWIARNILNSMKRVVWVKVRVAGASTITQQLLKNILALDSNEEWVYDKIVRKHKEWLLVGKLSDVIKTHIKKEFPWISSEELDRKAKERVMELYINFIYLGHQAHGIQAAAQAYFATNANDLSIVQSAALAALPQSPSYYDLYNHPARVLGKLTIQDTNWEIVSSGSVYSNVINEIASIVLSTDKTITKDWSAFQRFTTSIVPDTLTINGAIYTVSYTAWRKDAVLNRMHQDWYITQEELKQAFIDGLELKLASGKTTIKAPHFVFWVRDLILKDPKFEWLHITEQDLYEGWYTIQTSLDYSIQLIAEQSIKNNMPVVHDNGWNNRSLIHIDAMSGDVLAYVWSANYNNNDIDWQVDMIRAKRQPWSIIKALVYAYFFQSVPSTLDTPIYDIPFTVGGLTPRNSDGKFEGLIPAKKALAYSRNIPAVKTYLAAGQEKAIKPFFKNIGLTSLIDNHEYWYSLALWAGEVPMLELAQAFGALSQLGTPAEINPILQIKDKRWIIIYEKEVKKQETQLQAWAAMMIRESLSNLSNFPSSRINLYSIPGLTYAAKSWTSNKVIIQDWREVSLARDARFATYTPSRVTLYRAGNANDQAMRWNAYGINLNYNLNKDFYGNLLKEGFITNEPMSSNPLTKVTISKVTWRIATENTPDEFKVDTLSSNSSDIPLDTNYTTISVDSLCGWKLSPLTPALERQRAYLFSPTSITSFDTQDIIDRYAEQNNLIQEEPNNTYARLFTSEPEEYCEGRQIELSNAITLTSNITNNQSVSSKFSLSYDASTEEWIISNITVLANGIVVWNYSYNSSTISDTKRIDLVAVKDEEPISLEIIVVTTRWQANRLLRTIHITGADTEQPQLESVQVDMNEEWKYVVNVHFSDAWSSLEEITLQSQGVTEHYSQSPAQIIVSHTGTIDYKLRDSFDRRANWTINISDYL